MMSNDCFRSFVREPLQNQPFYICHATGLNSADIHRSGHEPQQAEFPYNNIRSESELFTGDTPKDNHSPGKHAVLQIMSVQL